MIFSIVVFLFIYFIFWTYHYKCIAQGAHAILSLYSPTIKTDKIIMHVKRSWNTYITSLADLYYYRSWHS